MRKLVVVCCLLVAAVAGPASAASTTKDPFPAGACVRVTIADPRPFCVIVDPAE